MKKAIYLILFTIGIQTVFAKCSMNGMQFFPSSKEISLNSMFIIQGYAFSQETINSFNNRRIYLESESGERIELNLQEILKGQMLISQAIFCPRTELKPNTNYFLKYDDQTENESRDMLQYNKETKEREKIYWKTTDRKFNVALNSNLRLEFKATEVIYYGCGPDANAIFEISTKPKSEIWYKTEVIELKTNKSTTYYLNAWNNQLQVGHGMCAGAFTFNDTGKYKVRFTPMNTDGKSLKTTDWITFDSPFMNDNSPFGN